MSFIIEPPTAADIETVAQLFKEDMDDLGVQVSSPSLVALATDIVADLESEDPRCLCWVARKEPDSQPVGVVLANQHWSLKFGGPSLWIEELYVTPSARRQGLGRALVEELLDFADDSHFLGIDLEAYHGNTPASVLYRSLGFHRLGRERFYINTKDPGVES